MLSHTFSGRLGKKSFFADNIRIWTDLTEPVDSYSHRFGQDLDTKQNDPAAETRAASQRGTEEGNQVAIKLLIKKPNQTQQKRHSCLSLLDAPYSVTRLQFLSFEPVHSVVSQKTPLWIQHT